MIDPATGWFEIYQYDDKRSITVANITEQEWFSRYPWPTQITFEWIAVMLVSPAPFCEALEKCEGVLA
jgi:hypothetical protein